MIGWSLLAAAWVAVVMALVSYDRADWPSHVVAIHNDPPANWLGRAGAYVAHEALVMLGPGVWVVLAGAGAALVGLAIRKPISQFVLRAIGMLLIAVTTSSLIGLMLPTLSDRPEGAGGLIAVYVNGQLVPRFNVIGAALILVVTFWLGMILAMDELVAWVLRRCAAAGRWIAGRDFSTPSLVGRMPSLTGVDGWVTRLKPSRPRSRAHDLDDFDEGEPDAVTAVLEAEDDEEADAELEDESIEEAAADDEDDEEYEDDEAYEDDEEESSPGQFDPAALRAKIANLPINFASQQSKQAQPLPVEMDLSGYQFPPVDILEDPEDNFSEEIEKIVHEQGFQLESALREYRIDGEVVGIDSGPVITLYEIRLAPGTKVAALNRVASDLARALKAHNIRIVPNTVGKDTVGVEVPNRKKERVRLKELMTTNAELVAKMRLPMFLGKDASGEPLISDLATMPHMLIAGTTGSGKSVCMNSIIMSWLLTRRPDEVKLVLVDPKMVEMSMFKDIPHLMCPVVTEMAKAASILEWAVGKMDERYALLAEAGVRDVDSYNELGWEALKELFEPATEAEEARIPKKMPRMVFVIDELADMMMTNKEVEGFIVRIAQKARAVGIHLILATQRPQANVVTGLIKGNMPCRVSFKVASGLDSRIVLDQKGAELLLGQGDMLYLSPRSSKLTRAQGTLVEDSEIRQTVKFLKSVSSQSFEPQLVQIKASGDSAAEGGDPAERDELFEDAVRIVLESQRGSVSLLQRRLSVGYSRASRLIEEIAEAGLIGAYKGSQAREVTMTLEEWDALKAQAAADAAVEVNGKRVEQGDEELEYDDDDDSDVPDEMDGEYRE